MLECVHECVCVCMGVCVCVCVGKGAIACELSHQITPLLVVSAQDGKLGLACSRARGAHILCVAQGKSDEVIVVGDVHGVQVCMWV